MEELRYQVDLLTAMNQKLTKSEKMYRSVCNTLDGAYLYFLCGTGQIEMLGNFTSFFPVEIKSEADLTLLYECVENADAQRLRDIISDDLANPLSRRCEIKLRDKKKWYECEVSAEFENDVLIQKIVKFRDITRFRVQNDELTYLAFYDSLTGLINRNHFVSILTDYISRASRDNCIVSVIFVDIDDFRKINDSKGIIVGDELVQVFGQYLNSLSQEYVKVSHFNSDTYCIAIYDPCGSRSVETITAEIRDRIKSPFILLNNNTVSLTVSMGIAEYPESASSALELIGNAEIVMFKAKSAGKNTIAYFDSEIISDFKHTILIETKLKNAVVCNQFILNFQPQYSVDSGKLRGVEALIRWKDENGHIINPGEFIPIAEKNGAIVEIGEWVLEEAVRTISEWQQRYKTDIVMSINISAVQYKKQGFAHKLLDLLEKYNVDARFIELEITESVLIDDFKQVMDKMKILKDCGLKVSLDDFGTGYSSLSYLKDLPIDTLKIDKSFIDTVVSDDSTRVITESIVSMVKKLGYETVAEGVEHSDQYEYLKNIHCDNIQGFYLGKPMPVEEIEKILIKQLGV